MFIMTQVIASGQCNMLLSVRTACLKQGTSSRLDHHSALQLSQSSPANENVHWEKFNLKRIAGVHEKLRAEKVSHVSHDGHLLTRISIAVPPPKIKSLKVKCTLGTQLISKRNSAGGYNCNFFLILFLGTSSDEEVFFYH